MNSITDRNAFRIRPEFDPPPPTQAPDPSISFERILEISEQAQKKIIERESENSLRGGNSMIAKPVQFFGNRHNLMALGDLQKIESDKASADLRPNGVLQFPLDANETPPDIRLAMAMDDFLLIPWDSPLDVELSSQISSKYFDFKKLIIDPFRRMEPLSELLDCVEEFLRRSSSEMKKELLSLKDCATQLWDFYKKTEFPTNFDKYVAATFFLDDSSRSALCRFVGPNDFLPLVKECSSVSKIEFTQSLIAFTSPRVRPPAEFLHYLQKDPILKQYSQFESLWQPSLQAFFQGLPQPEMFRRASLFPDYFQDWCTTFRQDDVFERFVQEQLRVREMSGLFATLQCLKASPSTPFVEMKIPEVYAELAKLPFSFKMIEHIFQSRGRPIHLEERKFIQHLKRFLPPLNKALISYELLQKETERLDLSRFRPMEIESGGKRFLVYDTSEASFRFFVHSAGLHESWIEWTKEQRISSGFLCVSLISDELNYFYHSQISYAMVLSVDPRNIVATHNRDAFSPFADKKQTDEFYYFHQRLQLLTGYIDQLYIESGIQGQTTTDDFSRLNRLQSLQIVHPDREVDRIFEELRQKFVAPSEGDESYHYLYEHCGISLLKVKALLEFYSQHVDRLRPGLLSELETCRTLLAETNLGEYHLQKNRNPIQGVTELLLQTPSQSPHLDNKHGCTPYNEINLDLKTRYQPGRDPIHLKAILIDSEGFQADPKSYHDVLLNTAQNKIPVLLRTPPLHPPFKTWVELKKHASNGDWPQFQTLFETASNSDVHAGEALITAAIHKQSAFVAKLLQYLPTISEGKISRALEVAKRNIDIETQKAILNIPVRASLQ